MKHGPDIFGIAPGLPLRFGVRSAEAEAAGSWQTTWSATLNADGSGAEDFSTRCVIPATGISLSGPKIRITCNASSAGISSVDNVSIVERSSGKDGTTTPTEILFNGGQHGFSLGAGQSIVSDELVYSLDETKDYLVTFDISSTNGRTRGLSGVTTSYFQPSFNGYNLQSGAGYTGTGSSFDYISKIEVFV